MKKTFKMGGIHPNDGKISADIAIETLAPTSKVAISMAQHLGAPATPVVVKGDKVKVGQVIGQPSGFISGFVHSSVSGTVTAVQPMADLAGNMVMHVCIDVEGDEWLETIDRSDALVTEIPEDVAVTIEKIKAAGIVGMGGATFPTHVKLAPPKDKKAEFLILNGAECEPYVTADDRLMRENSSQIAVGAAIMAKVLGVPVTYIAIEENKPEAIAAMQKAVAPFAGMSVMVMKKNIRRAERSNLLMQLPAAKCHQAHCQ